MKEQFALPRVGQPSDQKDGIITNSLFWNGDLMFAGDSYPRPRLTAVERPDLQSAVNTSGTNDLRLAEGRTLKADESGGWKYTVKQGDTLWDLATEVARTRTGKQPEGKLVNQVLNEIARASHLSTTSKRNRISVGQEISVPVSALVDGKTGSALPAMANIEKPETGADLKVVVGTTQSGTAKGDATRTDTVGGATKVAPVGGATKVDTASGANPEGSKSETDTTNGGHSECAHTNEATLLPEIVKAVTTNEGSSLKAVNWDDNGAGISVGVLQWNQERGALPELIREWNRQNPSAFKDIFQGVAHNGKRYSENLLNEHWLRSYNIADDQALRSAMIRALANPGFQQVQRRLAQESVSDHVDMAHKFNVRTDFGVAMVADIANQVGPVRTENVLRKLARKFHSESEMVSHLVHSTKWRPHARHRVDNIRRTFVSFAGVGGQPY